MIAINTLAKAQIATRKTKLWFRALWVTITSAPSEDRVNETVQRYAIPFRLSQALWYLKKLTSVNILYAVLNDIDNATPEEPYLSGSATLFGLVANLTTNLPTLWNISTHRKVWDEAYDCGFDGVSRLFVLFDLIWKRPKQYSLFLKTLCMLGDITQEEYASWVPMCETLDNQIADSEFEGMTPNFANFVDVKWQEYLAGQVTADSFKSDRMDLTKQASEEF